MSQRDVKVEDHMSVDITSDWGFPSDFWSSHWREKPAVGIMKTCSTDQVLGASLDDILSRAVRADQVSATRGGKLHHPFEFTRTLTIADRPLSDIVDAERLGQLVADGTTAILANVDQWLPPVGRVASALKGALGCETQAHVFATGPNVPGLPPHADGEDNFLIQLEGRKKWSLWPRQGLQARGFRADLLGPPAAQFSLGPGQILYIPIGWIHAGEAGVSGSLHLTHQLVPPRAARVIAQDLERLLWDDLGDTLAPKGLTQSLERDKVGLLVKQIRALYLHGSNSASGNP
jgi:ribosomal protein L16 Arg81 hydroxylase